MSSPPSSQPGACGPSTVDVVIDETGRFGVPAERDVVVYDGFGIESDPDEPVVVGACVGCGAARAVRLRTLVLGPAWSDPGPAEITPAALAAVVAEFGLGTTRFDGTTHLADRRRLSVFAVRHRCETCSVLMLQLVSYGEFQPARWMAFAVGSVEIVEG